MRYLAAMYYSKSASSLRAAPVPFEDLKLENIMFDRPGLARKSPYPLPAGLPPVIRGFFYPEKLLDFLVAGRSECDKVLQRAWMRLASAHDAAR